METDCIAPARPRSRADGWLDWVQMATGAALALFACMHMIFLSSVLFGAGALNGLSAVMDALHLETVGGVLIAIVFCVHATVAARKIPFKAAQAATAWRHARLLHHPETWAWVAQVVTAFILAVFITIHIWTGLTDLPVQALKSAVRVQHGGWFWVFLLVLPALALHLVIGAWRAGVKWGLITRENRADITRKGLYLLGGFLCLSLLTLLRFRLLPLE